MHIINLFSRILHSRWFLPVLTLTCFLLLPDGALAAGVDPNAGLDSWGEAVTFLTTIAAFFITIAIWVAMSFGLLAGSLMDSTYIFDAGMSDTLYGVWAVLRNFVNIAFIVILLVFAVLVVLGIGDESGLAKLKKVLPKFIIALVLVNLTFFGARVVLTTSDVIATAVFSMPQAVPLKFKENAKIASVCMGYDEEKQEIDPNNIKKDGACTTFWESNLFGSWDPERINGSMQPAMAKLQRIMSLQKQQDEGLTVTQATQMYDKKNSAFAIVSNMLAMVNSLEWKAALGGTAKNNFDVIISLIFNIAAAAIVAFLVFALVIALIARMVVLWILIAISPLVALAMVLTDLIPGVSEESLGFDIKGEFFKAAFVPVLVALPLSIGFIMILVANTNTGAQFLQEMLWWLASVLVLWFGTFKALKSGGQFVEKAAGFVEAKANSAFEAAGNAMQYVPIIPAAGGTSISELTSIPQDMAQRLGSAAQERGRDKAAGLLEATGMPKNWYMPTVNFDRLQRDIDATATKFRDAKITDTAKRGEMVGEIMGKFDSVKNAGNANELDERKIGAAFAGALNKQFELSLDSGTTYAVALEALKMALSANGGGAVGDTAKNSAINAINAIQQQIEKTGGEADEDPATPPAGGAADDRVGFKNQIPDTLKMAADDKVVEAIQNLAKNITAAAALAELNARLNTSDENEKQKLEKLKSAGAFAVGNDEQKIKFDSDADGGKGGFVKGD